MQEFLVRLLPPQLLQFFQTERVVVSHPHGLRADLLCPSTETLYTSVWKEMCPAVIQSIELAISLADAVLEIIVIRRGLLLEAGCFT